MQEPILYKLIRPIITTFFTLIFHPHIIGKENIPAQGKIILAGNHTNILDCVLLMSSTKRTIHFLAKYELTKGILGPIFKKLGIIPVNREAKNNKEAFAKAIDTLNRNQVIGIFPEGTTNKAKIKPTLPFKKGVVRMAKNSNSLIIPFAITGKYRILGKSITITFEKPYQVKSDNSKEEIDKFQDKINTMIIERR